MFHSISPWLVSALITLPLVYWYLSKKYQYFTARGIKGPKPVFLFGNIFEFAITNSIELCEQWERNYGKVYGYYRGVTPVLNVAEPELVKQILVRDFDKFHDRYALGNVQHDIFDQILVFARGQQWKKIRTLSSKTLTSNKLKRMFPIVKMCTNGMIKLINRSADNHYEIDAKSIFGSFVMQAMARCSFAIDFNAINDNKFINGFLKNANDIFVFNPLRVLAANILPKWINTKIRINMLFGQKGVEYVIDMCKAMIKERKEKKFKDEHVDFLQMLINAESSEDELALLDCETKLTENEVIAQALTFLVAGYETTTSSIMWTSYELALNPDIQQRLYEEVVNTLDSSGDLDYDRLTDLPYLNAVIKETLRLHNPFTRIIRQCSEDCELDGFKLTKGLNIDISIASIHLSPDYWPDPHHFNPDRFMPENKHKIKPYTFLPFGAGPRVCVAKQFALMQIKIGLIYLVTRFVFSITDKTKCPPKTSFNPLMNVPESVIIGIKKR